MAKYLIVDVANSNEMSQSDTLGDDEREAIANDAFVVLRVVAGKFERLYVEEVEDDDGNTSYDDSWGVV